MIVGIILHHLHVAVSYSRWQWLKKNMVHFSWSFPFSVCVCVCVCVFDTDCLAFQLASLEIDSTIHLWVHIQFIAYFLIVIFLC